MPLPRRPPSCPSSRRRSGMARCTQPASNSPPLPCPVSAKPVGQRRCQPMPPRSVAAPARGPNVTKTPPTAFVRGAAVRRAVGCTLVGFSEPMPLLAARGGNAKLAAAAPSFPRLLSRSSGRALSVTAVITASRPYPAAGPAWATSPPATRSPATAPMGLVLRRKTNPASKRRVVSSLPTAPASTRRGSRRSVG